MPTTTCPSCGYVNSTFSAECESCSEPLPGAAYENEYQMERPTERQTPPGFVNPAFQQPPPPPRFDAAGNMTVTAPAHTRMTCIKCGGGQGVELEFVKREHVPPLVYLSLLVSPLLMVILAVIFKVKHELNIPFCRECWQNYNRANKIANASVFGFIALLVGGVVGMLFFNSGWIVLLAILAGIAALTYGFVTKKNNSPVYKKVDSNQVVINDPVHGDIQFLKT